MDWNQMRQFMPMSFGKKTKLKVGGPPAPPPVNTDEVIDEEDVEERLMQEAADAQRNAAEAERKTANTDSDDDMDFVGPPRPADLSDDDDDSGNDGDQYDIPIKEQVEISGHEKTVTALAVDPSGARLFTGGADYNVRLHDFAGMDKSLKAFREIQPCAGHLIRALDFSPSGDQLIVASGSARAKLLNRDGNELAEFPRGDMYIVDLAQTKGHLGALSGAAYHPLERNQVMTFSEDTTVRLWDLSNIQKNKAVIKHKTEKGVKTFVTSANYSPSGKSIVAGCQDGSIQVWSVGGPFARPTMLIRQAHEAGKDISSVVVSHDGMSILSRGGDNTMKIWDIRKVDAPVHVWENLPNYSQQTDAIFSPSDNVVVTGTSVGKAGGRGQLLFYDRTNFELVRGVHVSAASIVRVLWHSKINQIFVGSADTKTHCFFDNTMSSRGLLMCANRKSRASDPVRIDGPGGIICAPHALPEGEMTRPLTKYKREREEPDFRDYGPKKKVIFPEPAEIPRLPKQTTLMKAKAAKAQDALIQEDPREALLRYAGDGKRYFSAYDKTQPATVLQTADGKKLVESKEGKIEEK